MQRIKIVSTILCDARVTFNSEEMEHVFCFKSKLILNPEKTESFLLHILSRILQEKQGYPESRKILNYGVSRCMESHGDDHQLKCNIIINNFKAY